jgi:hypothetical protein
MREYVCVARCIVFCYSVVQKWEKSISGISLPAVRISGSFPLSYILLLFCSQPRFVHSWTLVRPLKFCFRKCSCFKKKNSEEMLLSLLIMLQINWIWANLIILLCIMLVSIHYKLPLKKIWRKGYFWPVKLIQLMLLKMHSLSYMRQI